MPSIDNLSRCALAIKVFRDDAILGHATGFIWAIDQLLYLVTNWHVVTGKNPQTLQSTDPRTAAQPNHISIDYWNPEGELNTRLLSLYDTDGPIWRVHRVLGRHVDVVAIPLAPSALLHDIALNGCVAGTPDLTVGAPLFILGYPFSPERYPIWKLATVASEPALTPASRRHLLVDTASRPGMSGSPVIRRLLETPAIGTAPYQSMFIGVYSGRLNTNNPLDAQLGMVWPAAYVDDILTAGVTDKHPDQHVV